MWKKRLNSQNFYIKMITVIVIILCIYPLYTKAEEVRIISHDEEKDYGPDALPIVGDTRTFDDGTVVVRIIRKDTNASTTSRYCNYEMFFLRIIHPNGTIVEKDIELEDVQQFNYCSINNKHEDLLKFELIRMDQILVLYYNATDVNDINTYKGLGMIIDFDGSVFDRTYFGDFSASTEFKIKLNIDRDKGFIIVRYSNDINTWHQYRVELDGTLTPLTGGTIDNITTDNSAIITTVDGDYAIAYVNTRSAGLTTSIGPLTSSSTPPDTPPSTPPSTSPDTPPEPLTSPDTPPDAPPSTSPDTPPDAPSSTLSSPLTPLTPQGELHANFIGYNQSDPATFLLYQTQSPDLTFSSIFCDFEYTGVGQTCSLTVITKVDKTNNVNSKTLFDPLNANRFNNFNFKINFLSSGSVVSYNTINFRIPTIQNMSSIIHNLPFGGYLITSSMESQSNVIYAYLFTENGTSINLGLPSNIVSNFAILPNNTLLVTQQNALNNTWKFSAIDCHKYTKDNGYFNTNIESTFPEIGSTYYSSEVTTIIIDYVSPVELSDGRISIYQMDDQSLRQTTSCLDTNAQCGSLENDNKRVVIRALDFTFSKGGDYYIEIENNFVKDRIYKEPLLGVGDNIWKFTINEERTKYTITNSASALLRLTSDGTKKFEKKLNNKDFFDPLLSTLADAVQIQPNRLRKVKYQIINPHSDERQLLISINVQKTRNQFEKDVNSIISDINSTITFKDQTVIRQQDITQYLDSSFGFRPTPDYWEEYRFKLLGVFLILALLVVLYILAHRREKKGHNMAIFKLAIFTFDLVFDILFIKNNANDIPSLFVPSLIFFTLPIGLNIILAFVIISKENGRPLFFRWFTDNLKLASMFTILSGADIEMLSILHSNIGGFKIFQAPFSDIANSRIFWGAFSNIFIEDFPQLIIQILYRHYSVTYDIIPILTLITSTVNLTNNVIGRLYQAINFVWHKRKHLHPLNEIQERGTKTNI